MKTVLSLWGVLGPAVCALVFLFQGRVKLPLQIMTVSAAFWCIVNAIWAWTAASPEGRDATIVTSLFLSVLFFLAAGTMEVWLKVEDSAPLIEKE